MNRNEAMKSGDTITVVFKNVMLLDRTGDALFTISDVLDGGANANEPRELQ